MPAARSVFFDLIGRDGASPVFLKAAATSEAAAARMAKAYDGASASATRLAKAQESVAAKGAALTRRFTGPLLLIGAVSAKVATDFTTAMTRIQTQAGASAGDVKILSGQVLALAKTAQQGPTQLANSLYHLKSVGLDNANAMIALKQASDFAALGTGTLEETTNALAGAWRTGIKGATDFHQAVATLNAIIGAGNISMEDLNAALGTGILPTAKTFGLTLKDVGAALALFTDEGVPADAAATRLRMTFSLLGAPSARAEKLLKQIGLSGLQLADDMRKPNGLLVAITDLKNHLTDPKFGLGASQQAALLSHAFGGGRSSSAILSLINNLDVLGQKYTQVAGGVAKYDAAVKAQKATPAAKFHQFAASVQAVAVEIGLALLPALKHLVGGIRDVVQWFDRLSPTWKRIIGYAALFAFVIGPALIVVAKLIALVEVLNAVMWTLAMNPVLLAITLIVVGLTALGVAVYEAYQHSKTFRDLLNSIGGLLKAVFGPPLKLIIDLFKLLGKVIGAWWDHIGRPVTKLFEKALQGWTIIIKAVTEGFTWLINHALKPLVNWLKEAVSWMVKLNPLHYLNLPPAFGDLIAALPGLVAQLPLVKGGVDGVSSAIHGIGSAAAEAASQVGTMNGVLSVIAAIGSEAAVTAAAIGQMVGALAVLTGIGAAGGGRDMSTPGFIPSTHADGNRSMSGPVGASTAAANAAAAAAGAASKQAATASAQAAQQAAAAAAQAVANAVAAEKSKLQNLLTSIKQTVSAVRSTVKSTFDVTTAGQNDFGEPVTFFDIRSAVRTAVKNASRFVHVLKKLAREGLAPSLIAQLAEAGPGALGQAEALLSATPKQLSALNRQYRKLSRLGTETGQIAANALYGAGVRSAEGFVAGLESQHSVLAKAMQKMADRMVAALKNALGIHSPSMVMHALGRHTGQGFALGIASKYGDVQNAAGGLANAAVPTSQSSSWASGGTYNDNRTFHVHYPLPGDMREASTQLMRMSSRALGR